MGFLSDIKGERNWNNMQRLASCSSRLRIPPVDWHYDTGFRVVLSLAENES